MYKLKKKKDIDGLKVSGAILSRVLKKLAQSVNVGTKLSDIDMYARDLLEDEKALPVFLNYRPEGAIKAYPAAICASVNDKVVHGVPGQYVLKKGDILKIDIGVSYRGYITDSAVTVGAGIISQEANKLMQVTQEALHRAIDECFVGKHIGDIGCAIESHVTKNGLSVIDGLTGHGVGFELHEDPTVYNYGKKGTGMTLVEGLVLAIEPMVSLGSSEIVQMPDESYATRDGSLSAHFEHTVAITKNGPEILTG